MYTQLHERETEGIVTLVEDLGFVVTSREPDVRRADTETIRFRVRGARTRMTLHLGADLATTYVGAQEKRMTTVESVMRHACGILGHEPKPGASIEDMLGATGPIPR